MKLDITLNLAAAVAVLLSIVAPGIQIEVDGSNRPTARPIPGGAE